MKKKGFTLIELLVVVLIIGILAAIALPQYTKAVEKSRFSEILILGRSLRDSANRYFLEHGVYPETFDEMDIGAKMQKITAGNSAVGGELGTLNDSFILYLGSNSGDRKRLLFVRRNGPYSGYSIAFCYEDSSIWCGAGDSSTGTLEGSSKFCKMMGGVAGRSPSSCSLFRSNPFKLY